MIDKPIPEVDSTRHHARRRHHSPESRETSGLLDLFPNRDDKFLQQAGEAVRSYMVERGKRENGRFVIDPQWRPEGQGLKRIAFLAAFFKGAEKTHMTKADIKTVGTELLRHMSRGTAIADLPKLVEDNPQVPMQARIKAFTDGIQSHLKGDGKKIKGDWVRKVTKLPEAVAREAAGHHKDSNARIKLHFEREGDLGYKGSDQYVPITGANLRKLITNAARASEKAPVADFATRAKASVVTKGFRIG